MDIFEDDYLDLSNRLYSDTVPKLKDIFYFPYKHLRLAAQPMDDIRPLSCWGNLVKLNISFTYITYLPPLLQLTELQMLEVDLSNIHHLAEQCPKLCRLKVSHDNFFLTEPLTQLTVLHSAVVYQPYLLAKQYANLREIRFEHVHPDLNTVTELTAEEADFYRHLQYVHCLSSQTIIQTTGLGLNEVNDFDDDVDECFRQFQTQFASYTEAFGKGLVEWKAKRRGKDQLNIYDEKKQLVKTYEPIDTLFGSYLGEPLPKAEFKQKHKHYRNKFVYYGIEDDEDNEENAYTDILKRIMFNNYQLNDEIRELLDKFQPKLDATWSVDRLFMLIKEQGLTAELAACVKYFDRIEPIRTESRPDKFTLYQELDVTSIKDKIWLGGKQYLLTDRQKEQFVQLIRKLNAEWARYLRNIPFVRIEDDGKLVHYKIDANGQEIIYDPSEKEPADSKEEQEVRGDEDGNIMVERVVVPARSHRATYNPPASPFNNIFNKDSVLVAPDFEFDDYPMFSRIKTVPSDRYYLNFYGTVVNFSTDLIQNANGYLMLGESHNTSAYSGLDTLLDKKFADRPLHLNQIFFVFQNRLYNNLLDSKTKTLVDYTEDVVVMTGDLDDIVGWGGTFYAFDVITKPHPHLSLDHHICIKSPLVKTVNHEYVYKCCVEKN